MRQRHHDEDGSAKKRHRQASVESDYTTVGKGDAWYSHPGRPTSRDRNQLRQRGSTKERPPFDTDGEARDNAPDWYEQDRDTADYAYGNYGHREPGHARSDPYPPEPREPEQ